MLKFCVLWVLVK